MTKNIGEHSLKNALLHTFDTALFQIALQKEKFAKRAFARGVQESILGEQLSDNLLSQQVLPNS